MNETLYFAYGSNMDLYQMNYRCPSSEVMGNEDGKFRVQGLPYGQYLVVETTVPKDVFQADPFVVTVDSKAPQSVFCAPYGAVTTASNEMLRSTITGTNNSIVRERYLTVSVVKKNIDEARTYFARVGTDLITHLAVLSSVAAELDAPGRLQILRDFFKGGEPAAFAFDLRQHISSGAAPGWRPLSWIFTACCKCSPTRRPAV